MLFRDRSVEKKLDVVIGLLKILIGQEKQMDVDIQALITQAQANEDAESAADALLVSLFQQLLAAINAAPSLSPSDRAALQSTVKGLASSSTTLAAAIVANTPAATQPPTA